MFSSHVFLVFFGEGNDRKSNLLGITIHEDLTNLYCILQSSEKCWINLIFFFKLLYHVFVSEPSYLKESVLWCLSVQNRERFSTIWVYKDRSIKTLKVKTQKRKIMTKDLTNSPSSYNCPPTFTMAIKCKFTFSSRLGAYNQQRTRIHNSQLLVLSLSKPFISSHIIM